MEKSRDELVAEVEALREELEVARREASRAASRELLVHEEVNRRILEALPGGVVHVGVGGVIHAANAEALRILGLSYDALTNRYTQDFDPETIWEDGSHCSAADYPVTKALLSGNSHGPTTLGVKRPDGGISWAVFQAVPVRDPSTGEMSGVITAFIDISKRRAAEDALRVSEAQLRSILTSAPNVIGAIDPTGRVLFINRSLTGRTLSDIEGKPTSTFLQPQELPRMQAAVRQVLATGESATFEAMGVSGRRFNTRLGPIYDGATITGVTFVSWDITELRSLEARVTIADRMASIGTLAAGVAHEINNPLTYVLASLTLIDRDATAGRFTETTRIAAAAALEGCHRIRNIVSDLSSFSHVGSGQRVAIAIRPLVESSVRMAQSQTRYRARVVTSFGETPLIAATDARLGQVFLNLIVNAAQAIPEGRADEHEIRVATFTDESGRAVIEISDTGSGIAPGMLANIFDPFVTTKPQGVGTGLGLYIARNVVHTLDGEISVESTVDVGTRFRVVLPPAPADVPRAVASSSESRGDPASVPTSRVGLGPKDDLPLRVLVVDDEASIASAIEEALPGHAVTIARSGRAAIAQLACAEFDLILCDLMMADVTGMDVHAHVVEHHPMAEARMVFMTGGAFTDRAREFLRTTAAPVIEKPFAMEEIAALAKKRGAELRAKRRASIAP